MALYTDLPVFHDTCKLVLKIFEFIKDFSREFKHDLGRDMRRDALCMVRNLYRANKATDKKIHLESFLDDLELLKFEIRISVEMRLLSMRKQAALSGLLESIGKQVVGWRNASQ